MKKSLLLIIVGIFGISVLNAEFLFKYDPAFSWYSPEIMGQGGSYTAVARGFNSLTTNPAGFAFNRTVRRIKIEKNSIKIITTLQGDDFTNLDSDDNNMVPRKIVKKVGEVTIAGGTPWVAANLFEILNNADQLNNSTKLLSLAIDQLKNNGLGVGAQVGGGYVGHGVGIGLIAVFEGMLPRIQSLLSLQGSITGTLGLVGGYAHTFYFGPVTMAVGADIRPMWRLKLLDMDADILLQQLSGGSFTIESILASVRVMSGWGIGFDAGVIAKWKSLSMGLALRDIAHTRYQYKLVDSVLTGNLSPFTGESYSGVPYITPMTLNIGFGFSPDLGFNKILALKLHAEYKMMLIDDAIIRDYASKSFLAQLHLGTEIKLLSFLALRAGLSGGYFTVGVGLDLIMLEISAAIYSVETGRFAGDNQQLLASFEAAIRF